MVPLNAVVRQCVSKLLDFNRSRGFSVDLGAPLFCHRRHGHLSVRSIQKLIKFYREQSGIDVAATPHTLRHAFTTKLASAGAPVAAIQHILGHRQLATTQVYTHVSVDDMVRATGFTMG